jgi:hypothetical protein
VQTLIVSVALLGVAVALSSPTSVVAVLVLLGMPPLIRVRGWLGGDDRPDRLDHHHLPGP